MRTHGSLTKWNEGRGFGFISPADGKGEIFVHISAFPRDGRRPQLNELLSYEIHTGPDGRLRAVSILRPGQPRSVAPSRTNRSRGWKGLVEAALGAALLVAVAAYAYSVLKGGGSAESASSQGVLAGDTAPDASFQCDGRTMCSQMTSCAEARYFVRHCPNTKMDGNNDGEPCEQQWCD